MVSNRSAMVTNLWTVGIFLPASQAHTALVVTPSSRASCAAGIRPITIARLRLNCKLIV